LKSQLENRDIKADVQEINAPAEQDASTLCA